MSYKQISPIIVAEGGTGAVTLTDHGVLLGSGTGAITPLAAASTGQTLMGSTGADPSFTGSPSFSGSVTAATGLANTTGAVAINSGASAFDLSVDASATTVSIATGGAAKTVTLGSTNSTSSLALRYGTSDFTLASATGTVMSALDTGEITYPLQPAFLATHTADQLNITGNGTVATVNYTTEIFDQNGDYDGTNTFTAPVTGRYYLNGSVALSSVTLGTNGNVRIVTSNRSYISPLLNYTAAVSGPGVITFNGNALCDMDAGDTATFAVTLTGVGADTSDVLGDDSQNWFSGFLAC